MDVAVRVLGPLEVVIDGVDVTPPAPKERALLALLVVRRGRVVGADQLMEELWPTLAADRARRVLQVRVAALRKLLSTADAAPLLELVAPGYRLAIADEDVDEHRFLELVEQARATPRPATRPGRRPRSATHSDCGGGSPSPMSRRVSPGGRGRSAGRRPLGRDRGSDRCRPGVRPPPGGGVRARRAGGHRCVAGEVVGSTGPGAVSLRSAVGGPAGVRARPLPIVRGARRGAWAGAPRPRGSRPGATCRARLVGAAQARRRLRAGRHLAGLERRSIGRPRRVLRAAQWRRSRRSTT